MQGDVRMTRSMNPAIAGASAGGGASWRSVAIVTALIVTAIAAHTVNIADKTGGPGNGVG